jgi:TolB protein
MNKKILIPTLLILFAANSVLLAATRKIAYEHGENIFVADLDGSHAKKVATGALPEISPDGTRVAFNSEGDAKNRPGPERRIAVADVASAKVTVFKDIPSDNCFGPVWSPDGKQLAFSIWANETWRLGLVNADGSGFHFLKNAELKSDAFGAPTWGRDGKSIFCHDLDNLYQVDLDGNVLKKWELAKVLTEASMNSNDRLSVSPDGNALLMDVDCGAEPERKNWEGPQPAVQKFDLSADKAVRITGKNDFVWEPFWLSPNEFLCIIQKEKEDEPSIYRMSIDGKNPKLVVKHARTPSASLGTP